MELIDLNGTAWTLHQAGTSNTYPANVPGDVHLDLMSAGAIPDPFYRDNEQKLSWIGETAWGYSRTFNVPEYILEKDSVLLRCRGLDTLAGVRINGKNVGEADNMFRTWEWDVKDVLRPGTNKITIHFRSVIPEIKKLQKKRYFSSGGGPHKIDGGSQIRKEPCNFGWDWGPICVTCGIWRPLHIVACNRARIDSIAVSQKHTRTKAVVRADITADIRGRGTPLTASVRLVYNGTTAGRDETELKRGKGTAEITVKNPKLWWPNGMGEQHLYTLETILTDSSGAELDTRTRRIGLRTIELVQEDDAWGQSFYFRVNGVPLFAKGGNWIPADVFQPRVNEQVYRDRLESCKDAHMNILRVWGGGIYEEDVFYDICDELGLMVWQDFMFACAAYPAVREEFLTSVKAEAEQNVARLRHHPCIALYCGNNELEQIGYVNERSEKGRMTWEEYGRLFDKLLPSVVKKHHPEAAYIPSSEYSPCGDRTDTRSPYSGDAHLWNVWHRLEPFEWYRTSFHRFCSEFGFQSFPEPRTVDAYTEEEDRNINSYIMNLHQRSREGNQKIIHYMLSWYRMPTGFENTLWLSQIQQGLAIKYAVEHWLRNMPRCMGSIYWQINDCWPVASWASIDSFGRWKALHYMAKRFYAPFLISGVEDIDKKTVEVHVTGSHPEKAECKASWIVTDAQGSVLVKGSKKATVRPNRSTKAAVIKLKSLVSSYTERDLMVWLFLTVNGKRAGSNFVSLARPRNINLRDPKISMQAKKLKTGEFTVTLEAAFPALWAWIELKGEDIRCSDNFICMLPGRTYRIKVKPGKDLSRKEFIKKLRVRSIYDTYQ